MPPVFKTLKIDPVLTYGDWADLTGQFEQHQLDALAVTCGGSLPGLPRTRTQDPTALPVTGSAPDPRPAPRHSGTQRVVHPGRRRRSLPTNLPTVGLYNFAVVRSDLPEDLAYAIVNAVFSRHEEMVRAHPAATATIPANFVHNGFLPFHDGATGGTGTRPTSSWATDAWATGSEMGSSAEATRGSSTPWPAGALGPGHRGRGGRNHGVAGGGLFSAERWCIIY